MTSHRLFETIKRQLWEAVLTFLRALTDTLCDFESDSGRYGDSARGLALEQLSRLTGLVERPEWLGTDGLLSRFGKRRKRAIEQYH